MRLLILSPFVPHPGAPHGGGAYLGTLAKAMSGHATVGLVAFARPDDLPTTAPGGPDWRWLATTPFRARPRRGRLMHEARMVWSWGIRGDPLLVGKHRDPRLRALIGRALAEFEPEVVMVEMAVMAQYLDCLRQVPTIFTDHEAGVPDTTTGLGALADRRDCRLWKRYVRRTYRAANVVQALTDEDATTLATLIGRPVGRRGPVLTLPERPAEPGRNPPRALFLGDYLHRPNPEAAVILAREVLPRLRAAEPAAELWLAGPNQDCLADLGGLPGVRLCGFVPDLAELLGQVRLVLSPLFSGGGFRMKNMTALAHGVPVVTNALGARGVSAPATARIVEDSLPGIVDAALSLLRSPAAAAAAGAAGFRWARENLCADQLARRQLDLAQTLLGARSRGSAASAFLRGAR